MVTVILLYAIFIARTLLWALLIKLNSVFCVRPQRRVSSGFNTRDYRALPNAYSLLSSFAHQIM